MFFNICLGLRIGKGEGFADLEYGMMASVGAVDENTVVLTTVHDCQLMDLPEELFGEHDVTIDYICTPTQVIECSRRPKPNGIIWSLLGLEKFKQIPILKVRLLYVHLTCMKLSDVMCSHS